MQPVESPHTRRITVTIIVALTVALTAFVAPALAADSDGDSLPDEEERDTYQTDPNDPDTDNDGLSDGREVELGTDPTSPDTDEDGLTDYEEVREYNTDPTAVDTDRDGVDDHAEVKAGTDPTDPSDPPNETRTSDSCTPKNSGRTVSAVTGVVSIAGAALVGLIGGAVVLRHRKSD